MADPELSGENILGLTFTSSGPSPCRTARRCASFSFSPLSSSGSISNKVCMSQKGSRISGEREMIPAIPEMVVRTRDLALRLAAGSDVGGECLRFAARNAQRIPFAGALRREMFGQKYDLANVMRVVCQLAVDGLPHRVRFASNRRRRRQFPVRQRIQRVAQLA